MTTEKLYYLNRTIIPLFFILISYPSYSQFHSVSGFVEDSYTGERLAGAFVYDYTEKNIVQTNDFGFFRIMTNSDVSVQASYMGTKSELLRFHLSGDTLLKLKIIQVIGLNEVQISSEMANNRFGAILGYSRLPVKQLLLMPALGEADIVKSLQNQPGIKGGLEGSTGMFVRGGSSGENLFLLDDVPLYNVSHLYGFFSTFNSSVVKDVKLYKGCFPARYGGRVSSVIDVRSIDGNQEELKGELSIGIISSHFMAEGPTSNHKTTFVVSGRRSYFDLYSGIFDKLTLLGLNFPGYSFYDFNTRIAHAISAKDKIYLNFYTGRDKIYDRISNIYTANNHATYSEMTEEKSGWGNITGSVRWNHLTDNLLFINTTISGTGYNYNVSENYRSLQNDSLAGEQLSRSYTAEYSSNVTDILLKSDFEYSFSNFHKINFGLGTTLHIFNPGKNSYSSNSTTTGQITETSMNSIKIQSNEPYLYFDDEFKAGEKIIIRSGLRISSFITRRQTKINPEPRISANFKILPALSLKAGYSRMFQYMHLLSNSGLSMPTDFWIPAVKPVYPEKSDQVNAGLTCQLSENVDLSIEAYKKYLTNTTDFKNGYSVFSTSENWYDRVTQGKGEARGVEISLKKSGKILSFDVNYTLSKATRIYDDLNNGREFPFRYDRLHDLNISLNYKISEKWNISALWVYGTGYPVTVPVEKYSPSINLVSGFQHNLIYYYPSLNNFRLSDYKRLDVGIHYSIRRKKTEHNISLDVFNALNRKNPVNMYYIQNFSLKYVYLFPFMPSLTYTIKFNTL